MYAHSLDKLVLNSRSVPMLRPYIGYTMLDWNGYIKFIQLYT